MPQYYYHQEALNRIGFAAVMAGEDTKIAKENLRQYPETATFMYWEPGHEMQRSIMDHEETIAFFYNIMGFVKLPCHYKDKSRPIMVPNKDETIDAEFYTFGRLEWLVKWKMTIKENGEILKINITPI